MRTRIAPTPSGYLHLGNAAAFVLTWKLARSAGGTLLLRIDDLDAERARSEYVSDIFATLAWSGVDWDDGPRAPEEAVHWSQLGRMGAYLALVQDLRAEGLLYACDCSRKRIADRSKGTDYDGYCRDRGLDLDAPDVTWRLRVPRDGRIAVRTWPGGERVFHGMPTADPVIRQRNGRPAYQVASLSDDLHFEVDTIVRGMDLLGSTLVQLYMARSLGLQAFSDVVFLHHALLVGPDGLKLSKSGGATSLRQVRASGAGPDRVHAMADALLQAPPQVPIIGAWRP